MPPTRPRQIRRRKYICEYCDQCFYAYPYNVNDLDLICDDCREDRENEPEDEILKAIRRILAAQKHKE